MKISNKTIVVTGGSSGIGLEMCKRFLESGNKVITCSRSIVRLQEAKQLLPDLIVYQCDISKKNQCEEFSCWIKENHPETSLLINNAAVVSKTNFIEDTAVLDKLDFEIATNLIAPIRLIKLFYPILIQNNEPAIINVTTGLIFAPRAIYNFYNATKSALHSFTQTLRFQLKEENIKIIEVMFPVVDTPWHNGKVPKMAISVKKAVNEMIQSVQKGKTEIRISKVKLLYIFSRIAPDFVFKKMNSLS